jgi:hypothetical protein
MTNELTEARKELESALARVKILEDAAKPQGIGYVPKVGEKYCFIYEDNSGVNNRRVTNEGLKDNHIDAAHIYSGNCYPTKEAASIIVENRKTLVKLREYAFEPDWNDDEQEKWSFVVTRNVVYSDYWQLDNYGAPVQFPSKENAEAARAEVGDDAIRQLWDKGVV